MKNVPSKKNPVIDYIAWVPVVLWIVVIFTFSLQPGEGSENTSLYVTKWILAMIWGNETVTQIPVTDIGLKRFDEITRTFAHMNEYIVLGLLLGVMITVNGFREKLRVFYICSMGGCVSLVDEFMQIFVPGRYSEIKDFAIDMAGVMTAALIWQLCGDIKAKLSTKHSHTKESVTHGRRKYMNFELDDVSFDEAADRIMEFAEEGKHYVVTPNADHVMRLQKDEEFIKIYKEADLVITDGTPLLWIAESLGHPITERVTGADMFPEICRRAAENGKSVFILGGTGGSAESASKKMQEKFRGLNICGYYEPPMDFEGDAKELKKAIRAVNLAKPDIIFVCLGMPKQEKFIYSNKDKMDFHVALPFGAAVDFAAEKSHRAPVWMRKCGLEWFYRFLQEPGRLFHRYFIEDMQIFLLAWKYRKEI